MKVHVSRGGGGVGDGSAPRNLSRIQADTAFILTCVPKVTTALGNEQDKLLIMTLKVSASK